MMHVNAQVHVDTSELEVVFHCDGDNDQSAYKITYTDDAVKVYLWGTPEQLGRFADAIVHAVSQHTIRQHEEAIAAALR